MLSQAGVLGMLALSTLAWPGAVAVSRLQRVLSCAASGASSDEGVLDRMSRGIPRSRIPRSRPLRILLCCGLVLALSQFCAVPVALAAVAVSVTAGRAYLRGRRNRAIYAEDHAAVEGLGILVAELRAGQTPEVALATAGRHCGNPAVEAVLNRLSRSVRLGGGHLAHMPDSDHSIWRVRLIAGVRLSSQTGCAMADVIAAVESDLAGSIHRRADVQATAAGHRATVALLAGLPILGLLMGSGIGAEPIQLLTTTPIGHVLLLGGITLELLGLAWSRRLTDRAARR